MRRIGFFVVLLGLSLSPVAVFAATLVVDSSGGSYRSIRSALADAVTGDTIRVLAGTYDEAVTLGPSASTLALECESPDLVTIRSPVGNAVTVEQGTTALIQGCTLTGGGHGIGLRAGSRTTVRNSVIVANEDGIRNLDDDVDALLVSNCVVALNNGNGIGLTTRSSLGAIGSWRIENSIVYANGACGLSRARDSTSYPRVADPGLSHNNVNQNATAYCDLTGVAHPGALSANPGFVSFTTGDYRLRSDSAGRNRGIPEHAYEDIDTSRNDLGAYGGPWGSGVTVSERAGIDGSVEILPSSGPAGQSVRLQANGRMQ